MKAQHFTLSIMVLLTVITGCTSTQQGIYDLAITLERNRTDCVPKTVIVDENRFSYLERVGPGETIVLLHGFTRNKNDWMKFVDHIPSNYRVLALDLPGHGENARDMNVQYTPTSMSHTVAQIIDELGLEKCHVAGNSLGGLIAKLYASQYPERVHSLGLFDSAGVVPEQISDFQKSYNQGNNLFNIESKEDFDRFMEFAVYKRPFMPWPIETVEARHYIEGNYFHEKFLKDLLSDGKIIDPDSACQLLPGIKAPVLLIWGDRDRILQVSSVDIYKTFLKRVEVHIMKDCGHVPMVEYPEESAKVYTAFIEKQNR